MTREEIKTISNGFEMMKTAIEQYLTDNDAPQDTKQRFMRKLTEVRNESVASKPTDEEMRQWCLKNEEHRYNSYGQGYKGDSPKTDTATLSSINQLFSNTSSDEQKQTAQNNLKKFYSDERERLPLYVEKKIFPEKEGFYESCFLPTLIMDNDGSRMISPTANSIFDNE